MFPLVVHKSLPVSSIFVTSISVRGGLGNVSVYASYQEADIVPDPDQFQQIYTGTHQVRGAL